MPVRIALLRGVNLGAARRVAMADVRRTLAKAGFSEVRSLLQSGNLVFESAEAGEAAIEATVEGALLADLGLRTEVVVRGGEAWRAMIAANPFPHEAEEDPSHLVAMVLKTDPAAGAAEAMAEIAESERARVIGRVAYISYPKGIADSRLVGAALDKALGARGTARNWNTVRKLAAAVGL